METTTHPAAAASVYGRVLQSWHQEDLAAALSRETGTNWTKQRVSRMERGEYEPRSTEVIALAKVLDLPIEFVLYGPGGSRPSRTTWFADSPSDQRVYPFPVRAGRTEWQAA